MKDPVRFLNRRFSLATALDGAGDSGHTHHGLSDSNRRENPLETQAYTTKGSPFFCGEAPLLHNPFHFAITTIPGPHSATDNLLLDRRRFRIMVGASRRRLPFGLRPIGGALRPRLPQTPSGAHLPSLDQNTGGYFGVLRR